MVYMYTYSCAKIQNALAIVAIIFILSLSNVLSSRYSI